VAVTLTGDGEITYASFPITKTETTEDGDLIVYGKATDGSVDSDQQIVQPSFAYRAIKHWKDTGANVRVQHNPQRDPAGKGIGVEFDGDATWVKALVCEPVAQKLVAKGVLTAYSVGIARPTIERDITGKARGGIITDGTIVEISLVDRPANKSCGIQLVKSDGDNAELMNDVFGDKEVLQKMLGMTEDAVTKNDVSDFTPDEMPDFKFTPNDLAKIVRDKIIEEHYSDLAIKAIIEAEALVYKRDVNTAERRSLASSGHALPDGSYPIANAGDLHNAAHLARTGHGNAEAAKRLIARRAKELGVANPLDSDDSEKVLDEEITPKEAAPEVTKDPEAAGSEGDAATATAGKKVSSPQALDADGDRDGDGIAGKAAMPKKPKKGKKGKPLPPWLNKPADGDSGKCDAPDPKAASGAEEPADMERAPLGMLQESPAPAHMKGDTPESLAFMRFKTVGMDSGLGILHDLTCPAFHPDEVSKYYPYADFRNSVDESLWQKRALNAATGKSLNEAMAAQQAWQSAVILKSADPGELNQWRFELHKAFRDANPGPASYPTPGAICASSFCRPNLGGGSGHSQDSPGYGAPNSSPQVASGTPNAHHFDRPPLGSGQQSPSPSFMKGGFEYPEQQGVPVRLTYASMERDKARRALVMMHDHLQHQFPQGCPMIEQDAYRVENPRPEVPPTVGVGKTEASADPEVVLGDVQRYIAKLEKKVRAGLITEDQARAKLSKRTAEKYAASVSAQVQKGLTSRSEILKALGIAEPEPVKPEPVAVKGEILELTTAGNSLTPDIMKTMMSEILQPFQERISAQENQNTEYQRQLAERDAQIKQLMDEQQKNSQRWEDLANKADPSTASFAGLALNPLSRPAGVVKQADVSDRVQGMIVRQLERAWRTSENPAEREAAYAALCKMQGTID
jgi:hypothetical protein